MLEQNHTVWLCLLFARDALFHGELSLADVARVVDVIIRQQWMAALHELPRMKVS